MDKEINIPLSKILLNSKENIQLYTEKISRSSNFEQVHETNFHVQYKKKYGIKNKDECFYEDLSNIQKQLTLLSNTTNNNSNTNYDKNSNKYCHKYSQKMFPTSLDSLNTRHKDTSLFNHNSTECHSRTNQDSFEESSQKRYIDAKENSSNIIEKINHKNDKGAYPQLIRPNQFSINLNSQPDEDDNEDEDYDDDDDDDDDIITRRKNRSIENMNSIMSFSESESIKKNTSIEHNTGNDDNDEDGDKEQEDKLHRCNHLNYATFEFEGDYSKDLDSSGLFEFSLEGEKIVSSLCGPQMKIGRKGEEKDNRKFLICNMADKELNSVEMFKEKSTLFKTNNSGSSNHLDNGMSFTDAVTSTPEKDNSSVINECSMRCSEINYSNKPIEPRTKLDKSVTEKDNSINRYAGGDKLSIDNNPREMKCVILQQMSTNCVEMRSGASYGTWMIGRIRPIENKEGSTTKPEFCNSLKGDIQNENKGHNVTNDSSIEELSSDINKSASVPNIFSMINKFNQGDTSFIMPKHEIFGQNETREAKSEILEVCDDEISFRKSAIKGCLIFERIMKDLHIVTNEQDLENYCKTVKRRVSVANSLDNHEFTVLISELIMGFLKLADSWGILNSYFGGCGNCQLKNQNLDDINFYQSFQDWQIKSRNLLDHLTKVVQNFKEFIPKIDEKENKLFKEPQTITSQYNSVFNMTQPKGGTTISTNKNENSNFLQTQSQQKDESLKSKNLPQTPLQLQEIQFPKNIANLFTAYNQNNPWKQTISENSLKKPDTCWDLPQNNQQQNMFNQQSLSERKVRKKWTLTMPNIQSEPTSPQIVSNPGITIQPTGQIPTLNYQYVAQNKGPMENMMVQPFNFFGNHYNPVPVPHNMQNIRENATFSFGRPPAFYPNLKQSPKRKSSLNFKTEEHLHKEIINNNPVFNRMNTCNQQMNIPILQNTINPNPFGLIEEPKNNLIYQNFCIGDGKAITNTPYGAQFFHNEIYQSGPLINQSMFCHKNCDPKPMIPLSLNNGDGDDSSEEYYPIKSYMKPGSYRVPNKSKSLVIQATNNLNYIFDDDLVTGITVPFTKTNIFSQSKKTTTKTVDTIEKSIQTNRLDEIKNSDLVWKAALASAEILGKSLICKQDEKSTLDNSKIISQENKEDKIKENVSVESDKLAAENNDVVQSHSTDNSNDPAVIQGKEGNKLNESIVTKPAGIKTNDWLIKSLSKLEDQSEAKATLAQESDRSYVQEGNSGRKCDSKTKNESDESDINTQLNDIDSECYNRKEKGISQKRDKNNVIKQKLSSNLRPVSVIQKPREYCQSRCKPWDKARDFSYQMLPQKCDNRSLHKSPANWIKHNRKYISRQAMAKLQDILDNLATVESNNTEGHKESETKNENLKKIINMNAIHYKLKNHMYESVDQIVTDIRQMILNSREINKEYRNKIELTNKLEVLLDEMVVKHFAQPNASDSRELANQTGSSVTNKNRRSQKNQRKVI